MTSYRKFEDVIDSYREEHSDVESQESFWLDGKIAGLEWELLEALLTKSHQDNDSSQSGGLAKALDLWVSEELRIAGFDDQSIWPRLHKPRVLDPEVMRFIGALDSKTAEACCEALNNYSGASANVLGSTYVKQVDVGMSSWMSGPEILISTKTMSSSFGKNLSNRFEEAYGDAKNLKGRHPLASLGFFFLIDSSIVDEPKNLMKAITMLDKLQSEKDAYDTSCLLLFERVQDGTVKVADENDRVPVVLSAEVFFQRIIDLTLRRAAPESHERVRRGILNSL